MFTARPSFGLPKLTNFARIPARIALGVFLLVFFLGYQPYFGYPPLKHSVVYAEATQEQTISSQALPFAFQLPHLGYVSTHFSVYHPAIDIAAGLGMPIHPITGGTVVDTGYNLWGLGLVVTLDHGQGYHSLYAHLGKIYVKTGQKVSMTDTLGEVGLTGNTSGPHTHLELSKAGVNINPLPFLPPLQDLASVYPQPTTSPFPSPAPLDLKKAIKASL